MTGTEPIGLRVTPPSLRGRFRRDPLLWTATGVAKLWWPGWGALSRLRTRHVEDGIVGVRIAAREPVAVDEDVVALTLASANGDPLPRWYAGSHVDVLLPSGRIRQYSLCGDPADQSVYRIAVRRILSGGGGSIEIHDDLRVGDLLPIRGPRNAFPLVLPGVADGRDPSAKQLRFVAGGIGITPILPMLSHAERLGYDWSAIYTGRSRASIPFLRELEGYGDRITVRTDDEDGLPDADGLVGPLDGERPIVLYCCGPIPMIDLLRAHLDGRGDVELHYERFSPPPVVGGSEFAVSLARSGVSTTVGADESLLAALRRVYPGVPYSCQQGFCGTCRLHVVDGEPEHRDTLLSDAERADGDILTCVSRCAGTHLTVDL
ncbi:MAG TPA: PDR/VanB family oxidoreductase [Gordonia sp. (in: high G+C Gram-positive bacteria)]|uniref:PDR/VanB family oxidoreductase n=1 Tax=unclassified Gordonia (in: high G+C Gram-positive bacteria) TaxID=2657482 RepID=UPI000FBE18D9|nr:MULTISPECIES: PDR/VanB family oxidoreductase [unclassified Gordonia (in: high G+C Gram-positive bacteria)]RUP37575.1 MAG: oxidoreductase [Gordonia sp. (in: high G+C Gram-positive bacteria)]HNP56523.1 PDR/VanB family oxidoreductase [Gordonia sp. (in: high G+C Gram-positive bacteria)]HRC50624.1 PDR/VanB family oxidoreductase [Gordonia sp. (in: high G+C Gram-positive bacteria)]